MESTVLGVENGALGAGQVGVQGDVRTVGEESGCLGDDVELDMSDVRTVGEESGCLGDDVEVDMSNVVAPEVGMTFKTWVDVECMYKKYGKQMGFGVSRVAGAKNGRMERRSMLWRCECWGSPSMRQDREKRKIAKEMGVGGSNVTEKQRLRRRKSKKCECEAKIYASMNGADLWEVRVVVLEHKNHKPIPTDSRLVKEYRMQSFTSNLMKRVVNDAEAGVPIHQIHDCLARERDGLANMPITVQDMRHVVNDSRRKKLEGGDTEALMAYLGRMRKDNNQFYYSARVDKTNGLQDVFWVDVRSKTAYEEFGDVVCFDTTYMTNDYELPFANFVGVNHHGQTTLFGCALISHEDAETFEWVFKQWLMCMGGNAPKAILTDQAAAMRKPIADVMPGTTHRWCIWHILQKLPHKLGGYEKYESIKKKLKKVIYNSFTPEEFENNWELVLRKFKLTKNEWLVYLFKERAMWVPAFMRDRFWAGMRTTQRVESIHSYFDKFVKSHTKLVEFGEKYIAAVEKRMCQERDADDRDRKWHRDITTGLKLEKFFSSIYTDEKFLEHQIQCERMNLGFVSEEKSIDEETVEYVIDDAVWYFKEGCRADVLTDHRRCYRVLYNKVSQFAVCECRMFDTHGIMCRHIIRVLFQNKINEPSPSYVLDRWKKNIQRKHQRIRVAYHDPRRTNEVSRVDRMQIIFDVLLDKACVGELRTNEVVKRLESAIQDIEKLEIDEENNEQEGTYQGYTEGGVELSPCGGRTDQIDDEIERTPDCGTTHLRTPSQRGGEGQFSQTVRDPVVRKKRGRPKGSRIISQLEKAVTNSSEKKKKRRQKIGIDLSKDWSSEEELNIASSGTDEPESAMKGTRSMKKNATITKRRSVCLRTLYFEDELIKSNNKRLLHMYDSSDDQSDSF